MTDARVVRHNADGIATLKLNRPEKLNALDPAAFAELARHVEALSTEADRIGGVILRAEGRAFCAGADVEAIRAERDTAPSIGAERAHPRARGAIISALEALPQIVVASIQGLCYTGGLELALACDFLVAGHEARFRDTHARLGLTPGWGMSVRLPRRVGLAYAKDIMFTGRTIEANEALAMRLVDRVWPNDALEAETRNFLAGILEHDRSSLMRQKRLLAQPHLASLERALDLEWEYKGASRIPAA